MLEQVAIPVILEMESAFPLGQSSLLFVSTCSDSGTFLGLGTVTGSVAILVSFSLQV